MEQDEIEKMLDDLEDRLSKVEDKVDGILDALGDLVATMRRRNLG